MCGQDELAGLEPDKLGVALANRWELIQNLDIEAHKRDAISKFHELQREENK